MPVCNHPSAKLLPHMFDKNFIYERLRVQLTFRLGLVHFEVHVRVISIYTIVIIIEISWRLIYAEPVYQNEEVLQFLAQRKEPEKRNCQVKERDERHCSMAVLRGEVR